MDLIAQALAKREQLKTEMARLDQFLAVAHELQAQNGGSGDLFKLTDEEKVKAPIAATTAPRPRNGIGDETAKIAYNVLEEANRALTTRDLLPLVLAHNIEIGGQDPVATLSARMSNFVKKNPNTMKLIQGQWYLQTWLDAQGYKETADIPTKATSAVSAFSNYGGQDGTALAKMLS